MFNLTNIPERDERLELAHSAALWYEEVLVLDKGGEQNSYRRYECYTKYRGIIRSVNDQPAWSIRRVQ